MKPFKTILLSKEDYNDTLSQSIYTSYNLIGVMLEEDKVQIVKNRLGESAVVTLDRWYELVKNGTKEWNLLQKGIKLPDAEAMLIFKKGGNAVIVANQHENPNSSDPTLSILCQECDLCHCECHSLYIDPSHGEYSGSTLCFTCLKNIITLHKENV
jgi:hypothetical protein